MASRDSETRDVIAKLNSLLGDLQVNVDALAAILTAQPAHRTGDRNHDRTAAG